tara:strand:- start:4453 stop:4686 length:234 start_codon:yes stop_codon:yes gene_type:complete
LKSDPSILTNPNPLVETSNKMILKHNGEIEEALRKPLQVERGVVKATHSQARLIAAGRDPDVSVDDAFRGYRDKAST